MSDCSGSADSLAFVDREQEIGDASRELMNVKSDMDKLRSTPDLDPHVSLLVTNLSDLVNAVERILSLVQDRQ